MINEEIFYTYLQDIDLKFVFFNENWKYLFGTSLAMMTVPIKLRLNSFRLESHGSEKERLDHSDRGGKIMDTTETTMIPFLLGTVFLIALVTFLCMLNPAADALGINPGSTAISLLTSFIF